MSALPRGLGVAARPARAPAGLRARGRRHGRRPRRVLLAAASQDCLAQCWSGTLGSRWRLSFPLTAAGQLRIRTGFPLATPGRMFHVEPAPGRTSASRASSAVPGGVNRARRVADSPGPTHGRPGLEASDGGTNDPAMRRLLYLNSVLVLVIGFPL